MIIYLAKIPITIATFIVCTIKQGDIYFFVFFSECELNTCLRKKDKLECEEYLLLLSQRPHMVGIAIVCLFHISAVMNAPMHHRQSVMTNPQKKPKSQVCNSQNKAT